VSYKVVYTSEFGKEMKRLSGKYPSLKSDFGLFFEEILRNPFSGTPLGNNYYKIRLAIKSKGKGKSGGARIITCV
jgi:mRNA-degrading endonuclease RelE of RelBE toxin-antitoxin system